VLIMRNDIPLIFLKLRSFSDRLAPGLILLTVKKRVIKEGLVCRLNYEEKRLYIHEIGSGG